MRNHRPIYVRCCKCKKDMDELKTDIQGIEEDIQGKDVLTFICPICKTVQKSFRRG